MAAAPGMGEDCGTLASTGLFARGWALAHVRDRVSLCCWILPNLLRQRGCSARSSGRGYALDWMPIHRSCILWVVLKRRHRRAGSTGERKQVRDYRARACWLSTTQRGRRFTMRRDLSNVPVFDARGVRAPCCRASHVGPGMPVRPTTLGRSTPSPRARVAARPTFFSPFTWANHRQYPKRVRTERSEVFCRERTPECARQRVATDIRRGPSCGARTTRARGGALLLSTSRDLPFSAGSRTPTPVLSSVRLGGLDARSFLMMPRGVSEDAATSARLSVVVTL
jgi:hypothetical protein